MPKGAENIDWFFDDCGSATAEVTRKNISRSFRSPLQLCICAIKEFLIRAVRVLTRVRKGERIVRQTRGSLPLCRLLDTYARLKGIGRKAMASGQPVTCQIRYTLNLAQLDAFETYARNWMSLIEQYGGVHHGYFIPRANPDEVGPSFPGLGYDGPTDVAIAMFTFPDEESYRLYRKEVATDPECITAAALVRESACFTRYERLFLQLVTRA